MNRITVQRAYLIVGRTAERVLVKSDGQIYTAGAGWVSTHPDQKFETIPGIFERWQDVPAVWIGGKGERAGCVYWANRPEIESIELIELGQAAA